jgi:phosphoserine phosphatase RsbU/P
VSKKTVSLKERTQQAESVKKRVLGRLAADPDVLKKMNSLYELLNLIGTQRTTEDILNVIQLESRSLFEYDVCFVSLLNRAGSHYAVHIFSNIPGAQELDHRHFPKGEGISGWVIGKQAVFSGDITSLPSKSPTIEPKLKELGIGSILVVPLRTGDDVIGALAFGTSSNHTYSEINVALAQLLGLTVGTSLKNTATFDDARKRISQIELINEVTGQMASMLQLEQLLNGAAWSIQKTFNYFDVTIFLIAENNAELELAAHTGNFIDFLPHGYHQNVNRGIIGWVARTGEKVLCNDVLQDSRYIAYEYHSTKSELATPIKIDGRVIGVLNVEDTKLHAFDETDAVVLGTLADQLGITVKNAKLYDEVQKANIKLTELDRMKSEFLGIVSHDFRSPLSSIILAGKSLLKNEAVQDYPRIKEYLQIIVDQANRLNQLAEDTLSITKLESGQLSYYFKIINVERMIQDAVSMVKFSSRHTFEYTVDQNVAFIKGDQTKLRQVVQNLISNAVKYSPKGGKVIVRVGEEAEDQILISITDEGMGIPSDQIDKLFQKFSRIDTEQSRGIKGAGLGLWICREVVEAHGGKIWIESRVNEGTTVKFTLKKAQ